MQNMTFNDELRQRELKDQETAISKPVAYLLLAGGFVRGFTCSRDFIPQ
jgi:hypothetical protein